jgi:Na+/melibiose symporter-like transporter
MSLLTVIIPSVVATILYCRLAEWLGIGRTWGLVACVILAIVASAPCYWLGAGRYYHFAASWAGLWFGLREGWILVAQHFVQFIIPLTIGWWFLRRKRDKGQLQLAS